MLVQHDPIYAKFKGQGHKLKFTVESRKNHKRKRAFSYAVHMHVTGQDKCIVS